MRDPIFSVLGQDEECSELVMEFIEHAGQAIDLMKRAVEKESLGEVRRICQLLKETGACYGFAELSEASNNAVTSLDASCSLPESLDKLMRLEQVCRRLRAGKPQTGKGGASAPETGTIVS